MCGPNATGDQRIENGLLAQYTQDMIDMSGFRKWNTTNNDSLKETKKHELKLKRISNQIISRKTHLQIPILRHKITMILIGQRNKKSFRCIRHLTTGHMIRN